MLFKVVLILLVIFLCFKNFLSLFIVLSYILVFVFWILIAIANLLGLVLCVYYTSMIKINLNEKVEIYSDTSNY